MDFLDDEEKMNDFFEISKQVFLASYSYLNEEDYEDTRRNLVQNDIEKVWFIEDNEVKKDIKIVTKLNYKGTVIAVLEKEREKETEFLIKDENNEYWKMGIVRVNFKKFIDIINDDSHIKNKEYCNNFIDTLSNINLKDFFKKKIENGRYFNECELKYIHTFYPAIFKQAKESSERIIKENQKKQQEQKQKVKEVNKKLKKLHER